MKHQVVHVLTGDSCTITHLDVLEKAVCPKTSPTSTWGCLLRLEKKGKFCCDLLILHMLKILGVSIDEGTAACFAFFLSHGCVSPWSAVQRILDANAIRVRIQEWHLAFCWPLIWLFDMNLNRELNWTTKYFPWIFPPRSIWIFGCPYNCNWAMPRH